MKRFAILFLLLLLISLSVSAAYKIKLRNGKVINVDAKLVVHNNYAYFNKNGLYLYIPVNEVDLKKTEKLNKKPVRKSIKVVAVKKTAPVRKSKPVFINDEDLKIIRERSHLANEPPLNSNPGSKSRRTGSRLASPQPPPGLQPSERADDLRSQLGDLLQERASSVEQSNQLRSKLVELKKEFDLSVNVADKHRLQREMDAAKTQISSAQRNLTSLNGQIQQLQQQVASQPILIQQGPNN